MPFLRNNVAAWLCAGQAWIIRLKVWINWGASPDCNAWNENLLNWETASQPNGLVFINIDIITCFECNQDWGSKWSMRVYFLWWQLFWIFLLLGFQFNPILVAKRLLFHAVERNFGKLGSEASTIGALRGQSRVHFLRGGRWMFTFSQPPNTPNFWTHFAFYIWVLILAHCTP